MGLFGSSGLFGPPTPAGLAAQRTQDMLGAGVGISPPTHGIMGAQAHLAAQAQSGMAQAYMRPAATALMSPLHHKAERAMARLCDEISIRVAEKISSVEYYSSEQWGPKGPVFQVFFKGVDPLVFYNVDAFPTEADISLILLRCP